MSETEKLTPEVIAEFRSLEAAATPPEWNAEIGRPGDIYTWLLAADRSPIYGTSGRGKIADVKLTAALRNNAGSLIAAAEKTQQLQDEVADLQQQLVFARNELNLTRETRNQFEAQVMGAREALARADMDCNKKRLADNVSELREAHEMMLTGGNHLASALIGWLGANDSTFPPYKTTTPEQAMKIVPGQYYDAWVCWRSIMIARDLVRDADSEETA